MSNKYALSVQTVTRIRVEQQITTQNRAARSLTAEAGAGAEAEAEFSSISLAALT